MASNQEQHPHSFSCGARIGNKTLSAVLFFFFVFLSQAALLRVGAFARVKLFQALTIPLALAAIGMALRRGTASKISLFSARLCFVFIILISLTSFQFALGFYERTFEFLRIIGTFSACICAVIIGDLIGRKIDLRVFITSFLYCVGLAYVVYHLQAATISGYKPFVFPWSGRGVIPSINPLGASLVLVLYFSQANGFRFHFAATLGLSVLLKVRAAFAGIAFSLSMKHRRAILGLASAAFAAVVVYGDWRFLTQVSAARIPIWHVFLREIAHAEPIHFLMGYGWFSSLERSQPLILEFLAAQKLTDLVPIFGASGTALAHSAFVEMIFSFGLLSLVPIAYLFYLANGNRRANKALFILLIMSIFENYLTDTFLLLTLSGLASADVHSSNDDVKRTKTLKEEESTNQNYQDKKDCR